MTDAKIHSVGVLTSGGDSPGMNAAIRAVVRAAHYHHLEVYGIERGYAGLLDGSIRPMGPRDVSDIINRGGTILRSARCQEFHDAEGRAQAAEILQSRGIDALVTIGGDGTYRGALALYEEHGIRTLGAPGTIDNDIGGTDFTIGFDTALNTALDAIDKLRDTARSHDRVFFVEVMGRHNGYLGMLSGIAGGAEEVLVPETLTDIPSLVADLRRCRDAGKHSSIVVVAEGDDAGTAIDIAREVMTEPDFSDVRTTVIGHLQRGGSPTAFDRVLASRLGIAAVEALCAGEAGKMACLEGNQTTIRPLSDAWEVESVFDASYLHIAKILAT